MDASARSAQGWFHGRAVWRFGAAASIALALALALLGLSAPQALAASSCPCSLFSASTVPATVDSDDTSQVELGVAFYTDTAGYIDGIRFYKSAANTGVHTASLWSQSGQLLEQATFTSESASGWQQVDFSTPVPVAADTTYIASYHTDAGHYSVTPGFFASSGFDNAPLHAPGNTTTANGLYAYGSGPTFPSQTYGGDNYYVDPVFTELAPITVTPAQAAESVGAPGSLEYDLANLAPGDNLIELTTAGSYLPPSITLTIPDTGGTTTIEGPDAGQATLSPGSGYSAAQSLIEVPAGASLDLQGVAVESAGGISAGYGNVTAGESAGGLVAAAIDDNGSVSINQSALVGNLGPALELDPGGSATLTDSTVGADSGVGIEELGGALTLVNSTVAFNAGGGISYDAGGPVSLTNSIVAENSPGGDCKSKPVDTLRSQPRLRWIVRRGGIERAEPAALQPGRKPCARRRRHAELSA